MVFKQVLSHGVRFKMYKNNVQGKHYITDEIADEGMALVSEVRH